MEQKTVKDDILAFLDNKFANLDSKKDRKKKKKNKQKTDMGVQKKEKTPIMDALAQVQQMSKITSESLYSALASEAELFKATQQAGGDSLGVKAMKDFHLKDASCYEKDIKDKIFFIAQNAIAGNEKVMPEQTIQQQRFIQSQHHKQAKLSNNTIKTVKRMHEAQSANLKYSTFEKMHNLWLEYITMLAGLRPQDIKDGLITNDKYEANIQTSICAKLVKADFSGAKVEIVNAKNATMIGLSGIVIRETPHTFVIIQPDNAVKVLLKAGTVFQFRLPSEMKSKGAESLPLAVNIWGDNILYKGSERTKCKFKEKYVLDLY